MINADLAALYQVETFNLNKAVKRNAARFPDDFMLQLSKKEAANLTYQNGIASWGGLRTPPYAFMNRALPCFPLCCGAIRPRR